MKIGTQVKISAAHIVHTTNSQCSNIHGHTWTIVVEIDDMVKPDGMVVDFIGLKKFINQFDHKLLIPGQIVDYDGDGELVIDEERNMCFRVHGKIYRVPPEDVQIVDVEHAVTAEDLSYYLTMEINNTFNCKSNVRVYESEVSWAEASI